jgi:hypothetical protein
MKRPPIMLDNGRKVSLPLPTIVACVDGPHITGSRMFPSKCHPPSEWPDIWTANTTSSSFGYHLSGQTMFRLAYSLPITCVIAFGFQQEGSSTDSEREMDVYAIYSLMLTNPRTSHGPDNNERYLIASTTGPGTPEEPCVRPPTEREANFREVLTDYERRRTAQQQVKRALSIQKPYVLLSDDEVKEFMKARSSTSGPTGSTDERFRGVTDLFRLSDVYFNQRRTLALTAISTWCGSLCALYQWKVFEKLDTGHWEERPWAACVTVAKRSDVRYSSLVILHKQGKEKMHEYRSAQF